LTLIKTINILINYTQGEKMNKILSIILSVIFGLIINSCTSSKSIIIKDQWARPGIQGNTSAAYFVINNQTNINEKLIAVQSDIAKSTEIHISMMQEGKMIMQQQGFIEIKAKEKVEFQPKGLHVMFVDLKNDLIPGDQFDIKLIFENSGEKVITVTVKEQ
jgi:copper(I)-binding protein